MVRKIEGQLQAKQQTQC